MSLERNHPARMAAVHALMKAFDAYPDITTGQVVDTVLDAALPLLTATPDGEVV